MTNQINNQSIIASTDVIQLTLTLKMTTAQVVDTSVTVNNNSPIQYYVPPDDQPQPTFENYVKSNPAFKIIIYLLIYLFKLTKNASMQGFYDVEFGETNYKHII